MRGHAVFEPIGRISADPPFSFSETSGVIMQLPDFYYYQIESQATGSALPKSIKSAHC